MRYQLDNNATACSSIFNDKANATTPRSKIECKSTENAWFDIRPLSEEILKQSDQQKHTDRIDTDNS